MTITNSDKVIITCAVAGGVHTPTMSDVLQITPKDIATPLIAATENGCGDPSS